MLEQDYFFKRQGDMSNLKVNTIKGKTTEKLGLIGKGKAIACETISSVVKYD